MKTVSLLKCFLLLTAVAVLNGCAGTAVTGPRGYVDKRPQGATNGPGNRNPGTPGSGLTDAGINTGSGESANPVR